MTNPVAGGKCLIFSWHLQIHRAEDDSGSELDHVQLDDVIGQANSVSADLSQQRSLFENVAGKLVTVSSRFPVVNSVMNAIRRKKNRVDLPSTPKSPNTRKTEIHTQPFNCLSFSYSTCLNNVMIDLWTNLDEGIYLSSDSISLLQATKLNFWQQFTVVVLLSPPNLFNRWTPARARCSVF